jgi:hypothetical protein
VKLGFTAWNADQLLSLSPSGVSDRSSPLATNAHSVAARCFMRPEVTNSEVGISPGLRNRAALQRDCFIRATIANDC